MRKNESGSGNMLPVSHSYWACRFPWKGPKASLVFLWFVVLVAASTSVLLAASAQAGETSCKPGDLWVDPLEGMRFRFVPGKENAGTADSPNLSPLWVGETEVTQEQWRKLVGNRPGNHLTCGDDCPVEMVNWYETLAFANALSRESGFTRCYRLAGCEGKLGEEGPYTDTIGMKCAVAELADGDCSGYRLPTESEWEHSARAGTSSDLYSGDLVIMPPLISCGGPALDSIAWYQCTSQQRIHPVGSRAPNEWGLFDMIGNVSEWVWDCYDEEPCDRRVFKGCSSVSSARHCYIDWRAGAPPDTHLATDGGFRLVRSANGICGALRESP